MGKLVLEESVLCLRKESRNKKKEASDRPVSASIMYLGGEKGFANAIRTGTDRNRPERTQAKQGNEWEK